MLTFEDFFKKKKIDLQQLQRAEPALFAEFSKHYPLMGEKSFDHTKKYWFNNLRRTYPLAEEPKPHKVQAEAISQMAVQGVAVAAAQNLNEAIERPKFKEDNLAELVEENVPVKEVSLAEEEKIIQEGNLEESGEKKSEVQEPVKPAFKPRFNMQNIKKEVVKEASEIKAEIPEPKVKTPQTEIEPSTENKEAKPVYKPRFQMKNLQKPAVENPPAVTGQEPETENLPPTT